MKTLISMTVIATKLTQLKKQKKKYRNHSSVLLIKSRSKNVSSFSFNEVGLSENE